MYLSRKVSDCYIEDGGWRKILIKDTKLDFIIAPDLIDLCNAQYASSYYAAEVFAEYARRGTNPVGNYYRYLLDIVDVGYPLHAEYYHAINFAVNKELYDKYHNCLVRQGRLMGYVSPLSL